MSICPMIITGLLNITIQLLRRLDIDPNKFDINRNLVLLYYKKEHGKQYAFLTDQYCERCIHYCNKFELATNDEDIREHLHIYIDNFACHEKYKH